MGRIDIFVAVPINLRIFVWQPIADAWNIMNCIASIINKITITGWIGIIVSRDKQKDMIFGIFDDVYNEFSAFVTDSQFAVQSSHSSTALMTVSAISLLANVLVLVLHVYRVIKLHRNPLKDSVYAGTKAHDKVLEDNLNKEKDSDKLNSTDSDSMDSSLI